MNKGTKEGTEEEINFVITLNSDKKNILWGELNIFDSKDIYAVHIINHKYGRINNRMIKPKADVILCKGNINNNYIMKNNYYLNENDIEKLNINPIMHSGISVKRKDSLRYQILKMNPDTFKKIFGSYELGAGASIFCSRADELNKNNEVLTGWKTNWNKFKRFFQIINEIESLDNPDFSEKERLNIAKNVKTYSNISIKEKITKIERISDFVFKGVGNLDEPYTVTWFYEKGKIKEAGFIPFEITTGSGRSRGDFTIVVKPKN